MADNSDLAQALMDLPGKAYKAIVPTKERMFVRGIFGDTSPVDENYFSPDDLNQVRAVIGANENMRQSDPSIPSAVQASRYPQYNAAIGQDKWEGAQNTLGQFSYETAPNGDVIAKDRYDFNPNYKTPLWRAVTETLGHGSPGYLANYVGAKMIPADGKHGYDVRLNLRNKKDWPF